VNVAVVGGGMIGRLHIENLRKDGRAQVRWLCSLPAETLGVLQRELDIPKATTRLEDVLADDRTNAIILATPPQLHAEQAVAAIRAGKHLMIEKPLTLSSAEAARIIQELGRNPRVLALSSSARHARLQPKFPLIRNLVASGELGEIYYIHHQTVRAAKRFGIEYNPDAAWSRSRHLAGGGPFFDWGVYDLSFHLGLFDDCLEAAEVKAFLVRGLDDIRARFPDFDVEEHGAAWMRFAGGGGAAGASGAGGGAADAGVRRLEYFYERGANAHCAVENETRIYGSRGALVFNYHSWADSRIVQSRARSGDPAHAGETVVRVYTADMTGHVDDHFAIIKHFVDCLFGEARPAMTPQLEARHLDILFRILAEEPRDLGRS